MISFLPKAMSQKVNKGGKDRGESKKIIRECLIIFGEETLINI